MRSVNPNTGVNGMDIVLSNLNRKIREIQGLSMRGLIEASILIRRDMDETPPLIPVDTGNLRASWTFETFHSSKGPTILMGFTANYALFVHEMLENRFGSTFGAGSISGKEINWSRPGSGPKFFESALKRNVDKILETIKNNVRIE